MLQAVEIEPIETITSLEDRTINHEKEIIVNILIIKKQIKIFIFFLEFIE